MNTPIEQCSRYSIEPERGGHLRAAWRRVWPVLRQVFGWLLIALGIVGLFLPVLQGVVFLVLGVALVGRRNRLIRWVSVHIKLLLRRWAAHPYPALAWLGGHARRLQQRLSMQRRRLHWHWEERRRNIHRRGAETRKF